MRQALSISALARSTGATSKTLRYWERVGLAKEVSMRFTVIRGCIAVFGLATLLSAQTKISGTHS